MRKLLAATALATAGLAAGPIAGASAVDDVYQGRCHVSGIATFTSPLTNTQGPNHYDFVSGPPPKDGATDATVCDGTLNDQPVAGAKAKVAVGGNGSLSCTQSQSTDGGGGTLTFLDNKITVGFKLSFVGFGTEVALTVDGKDGGTGRGKASFAQYLPGDSPATAVQQCQGDGIKKLGFDADFQSVQPLVSTRTGTTGGGGGSGGGGSTGGGGGSTGGGGGSTGAGGGGSTPVATKFSFAAAAQKLKTALTKGIAVTLKGNAPARADLKGQLDKATAKRYGLGNGRKPVVIAIGRIALTHAGQAKGYLKLTSPAKRKLKNAKNVKVMLVGTVSDATRHQTKVNKTVLLR